MSKLLRAAIRAQIQKHRIVTRILLKGMKDINSWRKQEQTK